MAEQTIMARKDGRVLRDIPKATIIDGLKRTDLSKVVAEKTENDGFSTILNCRWCGNKSKEVYIPQLKDGKDGKPYEIVYNYEPCDACAEKWAHMVVIIEVTEKEPYPNCLPVGIDKREQGNGWDVMPLLKVPMYPTGRHVGITVEAAKEGINESAHEGDLFFMETENFADIFDESFEKDN